MGVSRDCPISSGTPYYLRNGKSYWFQIWPVYSEGPSEQKPVKTLEKRERGRIQGLPNIFRIPHIISGTGKATNFKFCMHIYRLNRNKSPLKSLEKRECGRIQGLPIFFGYPYYLRNGKSYWFQIWPVYSEGPSEQKPIKYFREKGAWAYPGTAQFSRIPPIISGTGKATNFKFCMHIYRLNRNKSPLKILRKVAMGVVRDSQKFSGHPCIYRAHRAVIFAIAQLSCLLWRQFVHDSFCE